MKVLAAVVLVALVGLYAPVSAGEGAAPEPSAVSPGPAPGGRKAAADGRLEGSKAPARTPTGRVKAGRPAGVSFQYDALGRVVAIERGDGESR